MALYGGIDLHSNNNVIALTDARDRMVYRKRLLNELETLLTVLAPYRDAITGLVLESTYNWYWLVDADKYIRPLRLQPTPSLQAILRDGGWCEETWADALAAATMETGLDIFPEHCPWPASDLLEPDWLPD